MEWRWLDLTWFTRSRSPVVRPACLPLGSGLRHAGLLQAPRREEPEAWPPLKARCFPTHLQLFLFPGVSAQNEAVLHHQRHMAMTLLATLLYSTHLPERLAPGRFDYIGEWVGPPAGERLP